jgi:hypothetical protein
MDELATITLFYNIVGITCVTDDGCDRINRPPKPSVKARLEKVGDCECTSGETDDGYNTTRIKY